MLATIPGFVKWLYPNRIWEGPAKGKAVYLTFDDGPIPEVTPWVLEQLRQHEAKATFFCIGNNIQKHPGIFAKIIAEGHIIGNHTHNHLNGWQTSKKEYFLNTIKAQQLIDKHIPVKIPGRDPLFRPPYGKMTVKQAKQLKQRGFKVVMWSVLSMDYKSILSGEKCFENVIKNTNSGSIIVFHDSVKAKKNLTYVLPKVLKYFSEEGYTFRSLDYID